MLRVNTSLAELTLGIGGRTTAGWVALGELLRGSATFQRLDLSFHRISDHGSQAVAVALQVNKRLTELNLGNNHITDAGGAALGDALSANTTLKTLNLEG